MDKLDIFSSNNFYMSAIKNKKDLFYFDNADVYNSILFFAILFYNNFTVNFPVNTLFWEEFLDFYNTAFNENKKISFSNFGEIKKINDSRILYSKGRDSFFITENSPLKTIQLLSTLAFEKWSDEVILSNIDDLFWAKKNKKYKLEMFLPIISPYNKNLIGVEKELWDNSILVYGFSLKKYYELLNKFGIFIDSPIKDLYSIDITKQLYPKTNEYYKCNKTTEKNVEYCYLCSKCFMLYFSGADSSVGFDRSKIEKSLGTTKPKSIFDKIKKINFGQVDKFGSIYLQLMEKFL